MIRVSENLASLKNLSGGQMRMMVGISQQTCKVLATLLFGILLSPTARLAQDETLRQRFNAVLAQHWIVGGGIAVVHRQQPATEFFFGVMRNGTHQR